MDRKIKIVAEQILAHHALAVFVVQRGREGGRESAHGIVAIPAANKMGPQGEPLVCDVPIERVEVAMESIQVEGVRGLEGDPL
ncbi:hypothetical protein D9M69_685360 [compost metagenome]